MIFIVNLYLVSLTKLMGCIFKEEVCYTGRRLLTLADLSIHKLTVACAAHLLL